MGRTPVLDRGSQTLQGGNADSSGIRNVALIGHGHSGKTSLTSALLYTAGATERHLKVEDGVAVTDYDEEELHRKLSITSALVAFRWRQNKINLIDTPGYNIFLSDTRSVLIAADAALLVLDGVAGVEVCTEKVWRFAEEAKLPCVLVVNKLDRERSSFDNAVSSIHEAFGRVAVPVQLPMGAEKNFNGVIDLIRMRAYSYSSADHGQGQEGDIPSAYQEAATKGHEELVEMIAEGNDELMEEFFATGTLPVEHIVSGLQLAMGERRIFPILCSAATENIGTDCLLDFLVEMCPPAEQNTLVQEASKVDGQPSVVTFKTASDPFAGRLSYVKVLSGVLKDSAHLINMRSQVNEKLGHIATPFGKAMHTVPELHAGDIGVVAKLKDTLTGDVLCEKPNGLQVPRPEAPEPSLAYGISAKSRNDEDRLSTALGKMLEEDLALRFYRDPLTKEFLLAGNGQQHVEIAVSRLKRRYGVEVELHAPKIPYRETIRGSASVQGRHKKQTGGHGQFGDCWIRMEPLARGEGFEFANEIFGGAIPKNFIPAVEKGIAEAAEHGISAGYPVIDFKVTLYDGSYHDVDSSEMAFKLAARKAFRAAMQQAKPALLEPIMKVDVETPVDFAGELMSDFSGRRGRNSGMDMMGNTQILHALVPMSEMLTYGNDLTAKTQGRASFHMEFDHYDFVPPAQAEKIIQAAKAHGLHADEEE